MEENIIKRIGDKKLSEITVGEFLEILIEYYSVQKGALSPPSAIWPCIVDNLMSNYGSRIISIDTLMHGYFGNPRDSVDQKHKSQIRAALVEYAANQLPEYNLHANRAYYVIDLNNVSEHEISLIDGIDKEHLSIIEKILQFYGYQLNP